VSGAVEFALHSEIVGEGSPTLMFLHYWGSSERTWRPVVRHLAASYSRVAYDSRGSGRSGGTESGFAIADLARDALSVVGGLAPVDVVLVGHSMCGKVAQAVATSRPAELRGRTLSDELMEQIVEDSPAATAAGPLAAIAEDVSRPAYAKSMPRRWSSARITTSSSRWSCSGSTWSL
jgi:pimeloyl-ACP methyl ester carboxylesterase